MLTLEEAIERFEESEKINLEYAESYRIGDSNYLEEGETREGVVREYIEEANENKKIKEWLSDYKKMLEERIKILFICDGSACDCENPSCKKPDGNCNHTSNIGHAKNFKRCGGEVDDPEEASRIFFEVDKTGEWINYTDDFNDWFVCSNCHFGDDYELPVKPWFRFCPSCGARMVNK